MIRRASGNAAVLTALLAVLLASTTLTRTYTDRSFMPPVVSAIVVAFALGWLGRRLDVPAGLAPAVSFVGFVEYLTVAYFRRHAFLGFVPTPAVFHDAGRVIQQGARDIHELAAPVVPTRELIFITVAGVFAAAVVVDLIALRLRRPVLAGLPLLALFVIPSSLSPNGAGWLSFSFAAAGYLALLTIEGRDRVHRWGRRLATSRLTVDDGYRRPVSRAARGIGTAAIGFALVVPGLAPGLQDGLLTGTGAATGTGSSGKGGKGGNGRTTISPVAELRKNLNQSSERELIRVYTDVPQYLRLIVLDDFTGDAWRLRKGIKANRDASKPIPAPPGLTDAVERRIVTSRIEIGGRFDQQYLPAPYAPARVSGLQGTWRYNDANRTIQSSNKSIRGLDYTVESVVATPDPQQLDDSLPYPLDIDPYTKLAPRTVDPSVVAQARVITKDETTDWGRVVALQNHFSRDGGFTYSVDAPAGTGGDALKAFLRDKIGYCEQYAAAMAVMVRAIGIPSRVVIGFTHGTKEGDYYSITNKDAHAWPEVYFPTAGWVRFEPTPPGAGDAVEAPAEALIVPTQEPSASASASASSSSDGPDQLARPFRDDELFGRGSGALPSDFATAGDTNRRPLLIALVLFLLLLVPVVPAVTRGSLRRRAWRRAANVRARTHAAWRQLYDDAYDLGFDWPSSASPRVAAESLISAAQLDGTARAAVRRLSVAEENARYAPASHTPSSVPDFESDVSLLRAALLAAVPTRRRLRAVVFPASSLAEISRSVHLLSAGIIARAAALADRLPARLRIRSS